jgi:CarD family transcriptional regulator
MFMIGDYAVCPGHGVGQIVDIQEREFGNTSKSFYFIRVIANGMTVMVPTDSETGIRALVKESEINQVYQVLGNHDVEIENSTWNRRQREYSQKIKTGSLVEIAEVLRALFLLRSKKNLSFGEKKMLDQCKELLSQEISLSEQADKLNVNQRIDAFFDSSKSC